MKPYLKILNLNIALLSALLLLVGCQQDEMVTPLNNSNSEGVQSYTTYIPSTLFYGLGTANTLHAYRTGPPVTEMSSVEITKLREGEIVLAIDFRPAKYGVNNQMLYGVTNQNAIYTINVTTGVATRITQSEFTPALEGTMVGFDFNPVNDRIRIITDKNQYLWISPVTGQVISVNAVSTSGPTVAINGSAFSNNFSGTIGAQLYNIDVLGDKLYRQGSNGGSQILVGSTGLNITGEGGFDIGRSGHAYAVLLASSAIPPTVGITPGEDQEAYRLYKIDLRTGKASNCGKV